MERGANDGGGDSMKPKRFLFAIRLLAAFTAVAAYAQLTRGYISGSVTDASGAMVPGVKIAFQETATGVKHYGLTNEAGVYRLAGLEPGVYGVEYEKPGFETIRVDRIELKTAQEVVLDQI